MVFGPNLTQCGHNFYDYQAHDFRGSDFRFTTFTTFAGNLAKIAHDFHDFQEILQNWASKKADPRKRFDIFVSIQQYRYKNTEKWEYARPGSGSREPGRLTLRPLLPVCEPFRGGLVCLHRKTETTRKRALKASQQKRIEKPPYERRFLLSLGPSVAPCPSIRSGSG
jgi:hypothetical protein